MARCQVCGGRLAAWSGMQGMRDECDDPNCTSNWGTRTGVVPPVNLHVVVSVSPELLRSYEAEDLVVDDAARQARAAFRREVDRRA